MKKNRLISALLAVLMIGSVFCTPFAFAEEAPAPEENTEKAEQNVTSSFLAMSYLDYQAKYAKENTDVEEIVINGGDYTAGEGIDAVLTELDGKTGSFVQQSNDGYTEWTFNVTKPGLYNIMTEYYTVEGNSTDIERQIYIDGSLPFSEAGNIVFSRLWVNATAIEQAANGDDETPKQVETHRFETTYLRDDADFYGNFKFYLSEGEHTIRMVAVKEPVVISKIMLVPVKEPVSYKDYYEKYTALGATVIDEMEPIKIQAETPDVKSSPVLSPDYDRSTPNIEPYEGAKLKLNVLGEGSFGSVNMWTEYTIKDIEKAGFYKLTFKMKQNAARGINVSRRIYINGEIPFAEAAAVEFAYSTKYSNVTLGDGETPYYVYLNEGDNTVRIESCLGALAEIVREVDDILINLNDAYRKIVVITGTDPDVYRDYELDEKLPEVVKLFGDSAEQFSDIRERLISVAGEKSQYTSQLETMIRQLTRMYEEPFMIQDEVQAFYNNLSSLGTWVTDLQVVDATMDYFIVSASDYEAPKATAGFFATVAHEFKNFIATFYNDYSSIGGVATTGEIITVWTSGGRDQAEVLKRLINSEFTPEYGINANLKISSVSLINALVAGIAPDVYFGCGDAVNVALRGALYDLAKFDDFEDVAAWYPETALVPNSFEGACYGLPTTGGYEVLFYRSDILEELGLEVPETWDDVYALLPVLERNNMTFGMSTDMSTAGTYAMFLYQNGGSYYNEDSTRTLFDSEISIKTMEQWSELYSNYGLPLSYDAKNRFRSGEMPLLISDYTLFNTLVIFAPQIRSLWDWALVPGTVKEDGSVDHSVMLSVNANVIPSSAEKNGTLDNAWTFLKWFCGAEAQVEFSREIENLLGPSGRYNPINLEALSKMPWSTKQYRLLAEQLEWARTVPQVPGSYYLVRYLDNSFRGVVNDGEDVRELLVKNTKEINAEITRKRKEFGLKLYEEE